MINFLEMCLLSENVEDVFDFYSMTLFFWPTCTVSIVLWKDCYFYNFWIIRKLIVSGTNWMKFEKRCLVLFICCIWIIVSLFVSNIGSISSVEICIAVLSISYHWSNIDCGLVLTFPSRHKTKVLLKVIILSSMIIFYKNL